MSAWYTCKKCHPHGMTDHSLYGDKKCLLTGCPCSGYEADKDKPEKPKEKRTKNNAFSTLD